MAVHNHGPAEGRGLGCPEVATPLGLRGLCVMGPRHADPRGINDQERRLVELEDSVRVRYLTDPVFHARVKAGARVLQALHPAMDPREVLRTALLVLAAGEHV